MVVIKSSKGDNPLYLLHLSCPGENIDIITDLPEQLTLGTSSEWDSVLPYSLADILGAAVSPLSGRLGQALSAGIQSVTPTGFNVRAQALSYQVWMGTTPIEFPLHLQFDHKEDAYKDVYLPIALLQSLALPLNWGSLDFDFSSVLYPPGPIRGGTNTGATGYAGSGVNLHIGRMMLFEDCIITAANATFDTRLNSEGYPISGEIELTFRTSVIYGNKNFLKAMKVTVD